MSSAERATKALLLSRKKQSVNQLDDAWEAQATRDHNVPMGPKLN